MSLAIQKICCHRRQGTEKKLSVPQASANSKIANGADGNISSKAVSCSTNLQQDQKSEADIRIAKLERQIAVIDTQIDKLRVYRGSLEKNLKRAKSLHVEVIHPLSMSAPLHNDSRCSPGTAARNFYIKDVHCR